jgi:hypothetical protein
MTPEIAPEMNLCELIEAFGSDDRCRAALERLRWPKGPYCPRCDAKASAINQPFSMTATSAIINSA